MIQELKEELELDKSWTQKWVQENKTLMGKTRLFNYYRDRMDVLHIQSERTSKLEDDFCHFPTCLFSLPFKEKLREMEGLKKRTERGEAFDDPRAKGRIRVE